MVDLLLQTLPVALILASTTLASVIAINSSTSFAAVDGLRWGTIGDSWDSGVAYSDDVAYDKNKDHCLRLKQAYGSQMDDDKDWVEEGVGGARFTFAGCSGANLWTSTLANNKFANRINPVMTAGGNNAGFGDIVRNCIYQPGRPRNVLYGPPYHTDPNGIGECKKSLKRARDYITQTIPGAGGLEEQFRNTLNDIVFNWAVQENNKADGPFWLYVTGYAHFFDTRSRECDKWTFAPFGISYVELPLLVLELRQEFNDLVEEFLNVYRRVINDFRPPKDVTVKYISVTEGFQGHRFCEQGKSYNDNFYSTGTYLWNFQYFNGGQEVLGQEVTMPTGGKYMLPPQDALDIIAQTGEITAFGSSIPAPGVSIGFTLRPFHPTTRGHTEIKNAVIAQLKKDKVPGVRF